MTIKMDACDEAGSDREFEKAGDGKNRPAWQGNFVGATLHQAGIEIKKGTVEGRIVCTQPKSI